MDTSIGTSVDTFVGRFVGPFAGSRRRAENRKSEHSWAPRQALLWALSWRQISRVACSVLYAAPIAAFFCPEIRAFTGLRGEISSTVSKVMSDRKVLFKHKNGR